MAEWIGGALVLVVLFGAVQYTLANFVRLILVPLQRGEIVLLTFTTCWILAVIGGLGWAALSLFGAV